jgi:V/A-type H+-transporting ATPase subunit E
MDDKIQQLTDRIYEEGFQKGEEKAREIIREAEARAARIVSDARSEAATILSGAQRQTQELQRNTETEVRLSAEQAIAAVKQQIMDLLETRIVGDTITTALSDPATIKEFLTILIQNWKAASGSVPSLEILLPAQKQEELARAFEKAVSDFLQRGTEIKFSSRFKAGFRIGPANGGFKISLTDEDFKEFFKEYLRPKTRSLLFDKQPG